MSQEIYDLIVIGGGSAALSAGIYAGRAMLDTLIIEKDKIGGQVTTTSEIVNYPAIRATTGPELMEDMRLQALDFGVEFTTDEIIDVDLSQTVKTVKSATKTYQAYAVIIATGASARKIGFPGEVEFTGRGIAYCSTCDGEFFQGLDIFVLGGGYAAAEEAVYLTRYGKSVTMIIREPDFTCAKLTAEAAKQHPDIKIIYNTEVKEITGDDFVRKAVFVNNETGEETTYEAPADSTFGMFVFAGNKPSTEIFEGKVELDRGYVPTNENMETNVPGVYAAGDLRIKELRQIVTAVADGAIAATNAQKYITEEKTKAGLPIVNERMEKRLAKQHAENKETQPKAEKKPTKATSVNNTWFPDAMREQLGGIFGKLTKNVTLLQVMDSSEDKSLELNSFLTEFASLSDKILLETVQKGADSDIEAKYGIDKLPSVVILNDQGEYTGIKFSGIPSGHEVNSIVLAVYNVGSAGQPIEEPVVNKIKELPKKKVQIFVSLTCHYCPDVVAACQRIASINHNVEAEMIDIGVFPELKTEKKIMSVPAMIIDDKDIIFGSKNMDEIIEILEK
ncbi:thioredoxin-disulfide reductase [Enterococcus haemoperoxidus ATCC BAA-382]|uniref:Thioredoxin-disulfide reductase n=1 Tax=Enterococcus haemoperoxidus ATCC BAA-382 TaxID=1158608 RepID=R2T4Q8_9ENTE|nr:FAD-dependent oxidoreductase [Enterococcus haemoperoxidus]EOH99941.1 thioredoxin-disulfide reductase [Enterococcus haemoperoxidus ATCC BAA-382]EOT63068.1 thioredoxin-disulfide reductase [Enterococcus haemoperoxidus ATCC BAA-382]OJG54573.1 thioredoxin-disulfide reductase [Enterococcus haemoperoxidus]